MCAERLWELGRERGREWGVAKRRDTHERCLGRLAVWHMPRHPCSDPARASVVVVCNWQRRQGYEVGVDIWRFAA